VKLLLDHCVDRRLAGQFPTHEVWTAADLGWQQLRNGQLLTAAADAGFEVLITTDKALRHEQDLRALRLSIVVLRALSNRMADLLPLVPYVEAELPKLKRTQLVEIDATGCMFSSVAPL